MEQTVNPLHILLVEDDPIIQRVHQAFLARMGHEVTVVGTGEMAITLYNNDDYDLILLDANLPGIDGFTVAQHIRSQEKLSQQLPTPIILLSAYPEEFIANECLITEINAFANKPITYDALQKVIAKQFLDRYPILNPSSNKKRSVHHES